ncbi:MAG: lipid-A-disaccharide synthase [Cyclobacteriaceae bacterium]
MKYYIIAGERSGDLHGGALIHYILERDPEANIRGWGGDDMRSAGMDLQKHYRETAFMGFLEVVKNLKRIRRFLRECKEDISGFAPDAIILIDYPGFNLRIAAYAKSLNIPVHYYISPKVWAWNRKRAHKIRKLVDHLYVIFPFEVSFFKEYNVEAIYVGNPLVQEVDGYLASHGETMPQVREHPIIAVLPGSRHQEVKSMLQIMLQVADVMPSCRFVVAAVSNLPAELYSSAVNHSSVEVLTDKAYQILGQADAAIVTSGTATLETALFEVPQVVGYKTSKLTYFLAKKLIKIRFISLVNIVADRKVVTELIQDDLTAQNIQKELSALTGNTPERQEMIAGYKEIKRLLGKKNAPLEAAEHIVNSLKRNGSGSL